MHGLAPAPCVVTQQRHFFKLLPQLPWHLDVHLSESKSSVSLQNLDELFDVPLLLRPMHNDLLVTGHRAQHYCAWVQCVGVVAQNTSTHLRVLEFVRTDSRFPVSCFPQKTRLSPPKTAPLKISYASFPWAYKPRASLPTKRTPALRRLLAFARVQHQLKIKHDDVRKSFPFLFWVQLSSFEIMLPTHDQPKPSSRIACLLSNVRANCISLVSPLLPFFVFSKATTSFRRPGKHLGQQCQRQAWN